MAKTFITSEELLDADVALQSELDAVYTARGAPDGFAPLNADAKLPSSHVIYGTTSDSACVGDDARLSNARTPSGSAGGDLAGNYPSPTVAKASQSFALTGILTPAQITANTNDYAPTDLATASTLRLNTSGIFNITGLTGGAAGRVLVLHNVGASPFILIPESASSTAANRFSASGEVWVGTNQAVSLQYDATLSRWRVLSVPVFKTLRSLNTTTRGTTSATYASVHQLTTGVIPAGDYIVEVWIYGGNTTGVNSATNSPGRYRVTVDATITGPTDIHMPLTTHQRTNADARVTNSASHYMYPLTLTNGSHTIDLNTSTQVGTFNVTYSVIILRRDQ